MTDRQYYAHNLRMIADISKEDFFRKMTFQEADEWIEFYLEERDRGYSVNEAAQRAWDCYYAARLGGLGRRVAL